MTFKPMPAKPSPMTNSATQNIQPWPANPQVMRAHGTKVHAEGGGRFQVQTPISFAAQVVFLEVGVDAGTKGFGEIRRVAAVSDGRNLHEVKVEPRILRVVHSGAQDAHRVLHINLVSRRETWAWGSSEPATTWA